MLRASLLITVAASAAIPKVWLEDRQGFMNVLPLPEDVLTDIAKFKSVGSIPSGMPKLEFRYNGHHYFSRGKGFSLPTNQLIPIQNVQGLLDVEHMRPIAAIWQSTLNVVSWTTSRTTKRNTHTGNSNKNAL